MDDSIKRKWGVYPEMAVPIRKLMSMSDKPLELGSPIFTPMSDERILGARAVQ